MVPLYSIIIVWNKCTFFLRMLDYYCTITVPCGILLNQLLPLKMHSNGLFRHHHDDDKDTIFYLKRYRLEIIIVMTCMTCRCNNVIHYNLPKSGKVCWHCHEVVKMMIRMMICIETHCSSLLRYNNMAEMDFRRCSTNFCHVKTYR